MLDGGADTDTLVGGAELQVLSKSGSVENVLYGGAGNDALTAVARITVQEVQDPQPVTVTALNTLRGGAGQGFLRATADASGANANALNYLYGDNGNDTLSANARATSDYSDKASNYLSGAGGDDTLHAKAEGLGGGPRHTATNTLVAGDGNDKLVAEALADSYQGGAIATNDSQGNNGDDTIIATGNGSGGYGSAT